ncbi:MAG: hypothetical protein UU27_C0039G0003 [Parcubacteria group bacterium GW2011_GWD1_40_9]|nr:MAG: hypothetical protein UU27_C0039G0003 [Parcubacteria group bacterium GW2011_GWD1_40_9]
MPWTLVTSAIIQALAEVNVRQQIFVTHAPWDQIIATLAVLGVAVIYYGIFRYAVKIAQERNARMRNASPDMGDRPPYPDASPW